MQKVLLIEDDADIIHLLNLHLRDLNCQTTVSTNGLEGYELARQETFDLIVLDLMLPEKDGLEICSQLRAQGDKTPILMLTAKSEEIDRVLGLEMGADDYLTKPFSIREFIARIKAIFRRIAMMNSQQADTPTQNGPMVFGDLMIDLEKRKVTVADKRVDLSPKEFELLSLLASHPGKSYDRNRLLNLIWGNDFDGFAHTVNSHINRLRSKIETDLSNPKYILTTWGIGYRFNEDV